MRLMLEVVYGQLFRSHSTQEEEETLVLYNALKRSNFTTLSPPNVSNLPGF